MPAQILNDFLAAGDGGLGGEHAPVDFVERLGNGTLIGAPLLELRLHPPLLGEDGFQHRFLGHDRVGFALILGVEAAPAKRQ